MRSWLYATAAGGEIAGGGETHLSAVGKREHALHKALAEGAASDNGGAVPVLHGASDDFAGRGGGFVDEHHETTLLHFAFAVADSTEVTPPVGAVVLPRSAAAFLIDDELSAVEELAGQSMCDVEVAAAVAPKVKYHGGHALLAEGFECLAEFVDRGTCKTDKTYVTHGVVGHEVGVDAIERYLVAHDMESVDGALAQDIDDDSGPFLSTQVTEDKVVAGAVASGVDAVDADELVANHDAHLLAGAAVDDGLHDDGVIDNLKRDADAFKVALQAFVGTLNIFGRNINAVGVEGLEHGLDGFLTHAVHVGRFRVVAIDEAHHLIDT